MSLLDLLTPRRPVAPPAKAQTGIGAMWMTTDLPLSSIQRSPQKMAREAQAIAIENRHIRTAERVIGDRFATVPWHLEDGDDNDIGDDSPPAYKAVLDLLEHPYHPLPGDPQSQTPRTRSALWKVTCRHMGVCGISFWYLDQTEALAGTPGQLLYVNPARMTEATDSNGSLLGWVMDADNRGGGVPLDRDKVLVFQLEPPDFGWWPAGLVQSAMSMVQVNRAADRHAANVLASGGRLAGMFSPKAGETIPEDKFKQLERDLRTITELPDAARRSLILQGPMDFARTAATPAELDLVAVANMSRDEIYELWGLPRSQAGGASGGGLNSGLDKAFDEAVLWQNAVGPRLRNFGEVLQFDLLDRFKALGIVVELEIEEPQFDDEAPIYDIAQKATNLPLTNDERRAIVGQPPLEDPMLGKAILLPINIVTWQTEQMTTPMPDPGMGKAAVDTRLRDRTIAAVKRDVGRVIDAMRAEVVKKVRGANPEHLPKTPKATGVWFGESKWEAEFEKALRPHMTLAAELAGQRVAGRMGAKAELVLSEATIARLMRILGIRIKGIMETTREALALLIVDGIERGLSMAQLGDEIEASEPFSEYRAELIARTETAHALNDAQLATYADYGITEVQAVDGDADEACAARDGQVFSIEDAQTESDNEHPNGTLDWEPIISTAKAQTHTLTTPLARELDDIDRVSKAMGAIRAVADAMTIQNTIHVPQAPPAEVTVNVPPATINVAAPIVNVAQPDISVAAPNVTVEAPAVTFQAPEGKAALVQDIRIIEMPQPYPETTKFKRDAAGRLISAETE